MSPDATSRFQGWLRGLLWAHLALFVGMLPIIAFFWVVNTVFWLLGAAPAPWPFTVLEVGV